VSNNLSRNAPDAIAMCEAASAGNVVAIKSLLDAGVDVNEESPDRGWESPLDVAVECGHLDAVKLLVACGARIKHFQIKTAKRLMHIDIAKFLIETAPDTSNLHVVDGWLEFLVVINLYIAPIFFVLAQIFVRLDVAIITWNSPENSPDIALLSLVEAFVSGYLVFRGIQVGKSLRDIRPRAVQNTKYLLKLRLAWSLLSIPFSFLLLVFRIPADSYHQGMQATPHAMPLIDAIWGVFAGIISFAIWYSYLCVSKRVRATYPDWND
jgi:hypothetical protein